MASDETVFLESLLGRIRQGDESARRALLAHAYDRLRAVVRRILCGDRLKAYHSTVSVLHPALLRLETALRTTHPETVGKLIGLSITHIRWTLKDLARKRPRETAALEAIAPPESAALSPEDRTALSEFMDRVSALPDDERGMLELTLYLKMSKAEAARHLGLTHKNPTRIWRNAVRRLPAYPGLEQAES